MKLLPLIFSFIVLNISVYSNSIHDTLVINKGTFVTIDSTEFPYYAFNSDTNFLKTNKRLEILLSDTLKLEIVNNTNDTHKFVINSLGINLTILPKTNNRSTINSNKAGVFPYSDSRTKKAFGLWGASGMLVVKETKDKSKKTFYWNIKDLESSKIRDLDSNKVVDWKSYYPDYFVVNGFAKDQLKTDTASCIKGNVGDSLLIAISNTGVGIHSIHFHGYHCTAIHANSKRVQRGTSKDTFPLESGDGLLLLLVPDKPGMYPVHDHNLIAVTGGGVYPNGIFMMQVIK